MNTPGMSVSAAITSRHSKRAFLDRPVPGEVLRHILATAARSPSGGNLQPWLVYALGGDELTRFKELVRERRQATPFGETPEYEIYPAKLGEPYRARRGKCGEDMYATMGIAREEMAARMAFVSGNFEFWNAPVGLFFCIDRQLGATQWVDLGMYLQSVMLLAREAGLDTCAQEAWAMWHKTVAEFLQLPPHLMLFCGMAMGYADDSQPVNRLCTERAALDEFAIFRGV